VKLRRDILLFGAVALAAVAGGWWLLSNRPGAAVETFRQEYKRLEDGTRSRLPSADAFRATVCADGPCVVVEAGGLTFFFGAASGSAASIRGLGLMHPHVDALLLPDLAVETVQGLPAIAAAGAEAGRREALRVYGPAGLLPVVDGTNLIVSATQQARLAAGVEGEDQGSSGRIVFDSGVVSIRGFGGNERGGGRVYRVDFDGRSLILAGCTALSAEIVGAAREAKKPGAIVMAGSERLRGSPSQCGEVATVMKAVGQAKLPVSVVIPGDPAASTDSAAAAWREVLADIGAGGAHVGVRGTALDLSGDTPRILQGQQR
jgi:hypothetical protein